MSGYVFADRLAAGEELELRILVVTVPCQHPDYAPQTGYHRGCRCDRCYAGVVEARRPRSQHHHQKRGTP